MTYLLILFFKSSLLPTCSILIVIASRHLVGRVALEDHSNINHLCFDCMAPGHKTCDCRSSNRCQKCSGSHHTCLHKDRTQLSSVAESTVTHPETEPQEQGTAPVNSLCLHLLPAPTVSFLSHCLPCSLYHQFFRAMRL